MTSLLPAPAPCEFHRAPEGYLPVRSTFRLDCVSCNQVVMPLRVDVPFRYAEGCRLLACDRCPETDRPCEYLREAAEFTLEGRRYVVGMPCCSYAFDQPPSRVRDLIRILEWSTGRKFIHERQLGGWFARKYYAAVGGGFWDAVHRLTPVYRSSYTAYYALRELARIPRPRCTQVRQTAAAFSTEPEGLLGRRRRDQIPFLFGCLRQPLLAPGLPRQMARRIERAKGEGMSKRRSRAAQAGQGAAPSVPLSVPKDGPPPKSLAIAAKGIKTASDFSAFMSSLMTDLIEGRVSPGVGNAACNAGGKLLKVVELQFRYGKPAGGHAGARKTLDLVETAEQVAATEAG